MNPARPPSSVARWLRRAGRVSLFAGVNLVGGCYSRAEAPRPVVFWTIGNEGDAVIRLLPEFERLHPDIHVQVQQLPLTAAHQKLLTAFAGGTTPDITQLGNTWIPEMVALNALAPLNARVAHSPVIQPRDYFASIWSTNVVGGQLYGIPWYVDTRLLFYRTDLLKKAGFDQPPQNWRQWRQMLAALSHPAEHRYGILMPTNEYQQLESLALQQPDPLLRDGGRYGNFESAGFKRALRFYVDTFRLQQAPPITNVAAGNPWQEFGQGVYAFYLSGPWNISEFRQRLPKAEQGDWSTAPLPGPHGPGVSVAGGSSLVIFRHSSQQAAAWTLIEYLSQPEVQQHFYELIGDMPPRRSSWRMGPLQQDPQAHAFREQLERLRPVPAVPEWEHIATTMQRIASQVIAGDLDIDQATAEMDRRTDRILQKRRWLLSHRASSLP